MKFVLQVAWARWVQNSTVCVVRFVFVQFARDALQDCAMYMFKMFVQFVFWTICKKGGSLVGPCGFKAAQCVLCEISSKSILHNVCRCTMCRAICVCCIVLQFAIVQFYNVQRLCANVRNVYFIILCTMCKVYFARSARDPCPLNSNHLKWLHRVTSGTRRRRTWGRQTARRHNPMEDFDKSI